MKRIRLGPGAEFDFIRSVLRGEDDAGTSVSAAADRVRVGPGDDCAIVEGGIAISTDLSVEDIHFRRDWLRPGEIGWRAAAAALSDIAAVAAEPVGVLVSLALPDGIDGAAVMAGARAAARDHGGALLGGDVSGSPGPLVIDVAAIGRVDSPVLRDGARPGDGIWVTGRLGAAAAAVAAWTAGREPDPDARTALARPRARVAEARWLAERGVLHALIDLSDGLAGDAGHLAAASDVRIVLDLESVPVHVAALRGNDAAGALALALGGGEDYELCLAAPPGSCERLAAEFAAAFGLELTRVGSVERGAGLHAREPGGASRPLAVAGFSHFVGGGHS